MKTLHTLPGNQNGEYLCSSARKVISPANTYMLCFQLTLKTVWKRKPEMAYQPRPHAGHYLYQYPALCSLILEHSLVAVLHHISFIQTQNVSYLTALWSFLQSLSTSFAYQPPFLKKVLCLENLALGEGHNIWTKFTR